MSSPRSWAGRPGAFASSSSPAGALGCPPRACRCRPPTPTVAAAALSLALLLLAICAPCGASAARALSARRPTPRPVVSGGSCTRMSKRAACGSNALALECGGGSGATAAAAACADPRSQPCRVAAGGAPTECAGLAFSLEEVATGAAATTTTTTTTTAAPAVRLVGPEASHYVTGPVSARGSSGRCSYPAPPDGSTAGAAATAATTPTSPAPLSMMRAPGTAVAYVDLCVCVPTTIEFVPVGASDEALLAQKTNPAPLLSGPVCAPGKGGALKAVQLPSFKAVDDCGRELAVAIETTTTMVAAAPAAGVAAATATAAATGTLNLKPGDALDLQGVPCGAHEVSFLVTLPGGELLATKEFTFEIQCDSPAAGGPDVGIAAGSVSSVLGAPSCL